MSSLDVKVSRASSDTHLPQEKRTFSEARMRKVVYKPSERVRVELQPKPHRGTKR